MKIKGVARKKIGEKSVTHSHRLKYVPGAKARAETMAAEIKHRRLSKKHERMEHAVWPSFGAQSLAEAERIAKALIPPATHYAVDFDKNGQPVKIVPIPARPGGSIDRPCAALSPTGRSCYLDAGHILGHRDDLGSAWPNDARTAHEGADAKLRCSEIETGGDQCVREWQHDGAHRLKGGPFQSTGDADELRGKPTPREPVVGKYEAMEDHHPPKGAKNFFFDSATNLSTPGIGALLDVLATTLDGLKGTLAPVLRHDSDPRLHRYSRSSIGTRISKLTAFVLDLESRVDA